MFFLPQYALALFLFPPVALADPIHIPLTRRSSGNRDINYYVSAAKHLQAKYNIMGNSSPHGKRASSDSIQTIGIDLFSDAAYAALIKIGTPPQSLKVILATGASDFLVLDTLCTSCNSTIPLFDPSKSSSITSAYANGTISFNASSSASGIIAQDVVSMGNFIVQNQTFLAVDKIVGGFFGGTVSGVMGLAFSAVSVTRSTPFWQALGNQLAVPEMAFYLARFKDDSSAQVDEPGGVFTLGGTNSTLFTGDIEFLAMPSGTPTYWILAMSAITVQGQSVQIMTGTNVFFDTSTTFIGGPTADVNAIWAAVPGSAVAVNYTGFFSFPCFTSVQVTLSFGGKAWPIKVTDINLGQISHGSSQCLGAIADINIATNYSGPPAWVVGNSFLKNVYSVFRASPPSIGFAQLSSVAGGIGAPNSNDSSTTNGAGGSGGSGKSNGGSSIRITLPAMLTTATIASVVLMSLL